MVPANFLKFLKYSDHPNSHHFGFHYPPSRLGNPHRPWNNVFIQISIKRVAEEDTASVRIKDVKNTDEEEAENIWNRFFPRLHSIVKKTLNSKTNAVYESNLCLRWK